MIVRLFAALFALLFAPITIVRRAFGVPRGAWIEVVIDGALVDFAKPRRIWERLRPARVFSLHGFDEAARAIEKDARVAGVVVTLKSMRTGMAMATSLRVILARLRAAGREVVVHLPVGGETKELYVASAANRIYAGAQTTIAPLGFATSVRYLKNALAKAGLVPEVIAHGKYKSAGEQLVRDGMSEAQREQLGAIYDVFYAELTRAIADGRGMSEDDARAIVDGAPYRVEDATRVRLIDGAAYEDEIDAKLRGSADAKTKVKRIALASYVAVRMAPTVRSRFGRILRRGCVGVIEVHGAIAGDGGGLFAGAVDERVIGAVRAARSDRRVRGVVLHVDSPGGGALASDRIHHELEQLAAEKPLVACFGNVAASGGYYVAAPAHAIVARPTTITGSIGVISARFGADPLLARLGITTEVMARGAHAHLNDGTRPLSDDDRAVIQRDIDGMYRGFVDVVARGRKQSREAIEMLAQGRVWSGKDAHANGLVDQLGSFDDALALVHAKIGARPGSLDAIVVSARKAGAPLDPPEAAKAAAARSLDALLAPLGVDLTSIALAASNQRALYLWPDHAAVTAVLGGGASSFRS